MIDYRIIGILTVIAFVAIFIMALRIIFDYHYVPSSLVLYICAVVALGGYFCFGAVTDTTHYFVNPTIKTTKYEVTKVKRNLDSNEKIYELTSEQGDMETLSATQLSIFGDLDNGLSKGDTLLKKQYTAKKHNFLSFIEQEVLNQPNGFRLND